jgi:hypothetical protein
VKGHGSNLIAGVIHTGLGDIKIQFILSQHTSEHRIITAGAVGGMAAAMAARAAWPAVAHIDPTTEEGLEMGEWAGHGKENKRMKVGKGGC